MKLNQKLIKIRKENSLTQEELADILCVSRQTVSNWETSKCYPDIETIISISDKFNISLDNLLKEDKEMIKEIDKKVKNHKPLKILITILIIVALISSIYSYISYKNRPIYNDILFENVPDGYEMMTLDKDKIISLVDFEDKELQTINLFIIDDKINNEILNEPLVYNAKIYALRDEDGNFVTDIGDLKYIIIGLPSSVNRTLNIIEITTGNIKIEKSDDNKEAKVNIALQEYLEKYYIDKLK